MVSINIPGRVVVFDYGEVISQTPSEQDVQELLEVAGLSLDELQPPYWHHREALDSGQIRVVEYWQRVAADLGVSWDLATIHRLWAIDFRSWITVEPGTVQLIDELRQGGTRLALLSNAGYDYGDAFRNAPFSYGFERVFVSAEMGLLKPDPEIYRRTLEELGIEPAQMVFVDNKAENIASAESLGITGHVFTGPEGLRAFLESLAESVAPSLVSEA